MRVCSLSTPALTYRGQVCVTFFYHMLGQHMGTLRLMYRDQDGQVNVWSESGDKREDRWFYVEKTLDFNAQHQDHWVSEKLPHFFFFLESL